MTDEYGGHHVCKTTKAGGKKVNLQSPTEARNELEKLFAVASAQQRNALVAIMTEFQERFNGYLTLLNCASLKEISIGEVNEYHRVAVVAWFEDNIIGQL